MTVTAYIRYTAWLASALALALASGCAMLQLGYTHLDTWAAYRADEYFDLDAQQRQEFRARFERLHEWHRREQLRDYAAFLSEARSRIHQQPRREDVLWIAEGLKARYRVIVRRMNADAAALLSTLKPEQINALQRQWDDDNRKFIRERGIRAARDERQRVRAERATDEIRKWVGNLAPEQERRVAALSDAVPTISELRLQERMRRQREFRELLESAAQPDFAPRLERFLVDWESGRSPEYERALTAWWDKRIDYFVAVYQILTPQQRAALDGRLQDYVEDFLKLAERSPGRAAGNP